MWRRGRALGRSTRSRRGGVVRRCLGGVTRQTVDVHKLKATHEVIDVGDGKLQQYCFGVVIGDAGQHMVEFIGDVDGRARWRACEKFQFATGVGGQCFVWKLGVLANLLMPLACGDGSVKAAVEGSDPFLPSGRLASFVAMPQLRVARESGWRDAELGVLGPSRLTCHAADAIEENVHRAGGCAVIFEDGVGQVWRGVHRDRLGW